VIAIDTSSLVACLSGDNGLDVEATGAALEYLIQLTHGSERLLNQYAERQRISLTDAVRDYAEVLLMDAMGGEIKAAQHWCSHCLKSPIQVFRRIVSCLPARGIMPIDEELVQYVNNKYPESEWKEKT
jgi:hypothetical protein